MIEPSILYASKFEANQAQDGSGLVLMKTVR